MNHLLSHATPSLRVLVTVSAVRERDDIEFLEAYIPVARTLLLFGAKLYMKDAPSRGVVWANYFRVGARRQRPRLGRSVHKNQ